MKYFVFWLSFLASISVSNANEISARNDVCNFISETENQGVEAGVKKLYQMLKSNKTLVDSFPLIETAFKKFDFNSAIGFNVVKLDNLFEQYFIVLNDEKRGNMYLGLDFEKIEGHLRMVNIQFHGNYQKAVGKLGGGLNKPSKLNC